MSSNDWIDELLPQEGISGGTSIVFTGESGELSFSRADLYVTDTLTDISSIVTPDAHGLNVVGIHATTGFIEQEVRRLEGSLETLSGRVAELELDLEVMKAALEIEDVTLRSISKQDARQEILRLFETGEPLDQADLAESLSLDFSLVTQICDELISEGVVDFYGDGRG